MNFFIILVTLFSLSANAALYVGVQTGNHSARTHSMFFTDTEFTTSGQELGLNIGYKLNDFLSFEVAYANIEFDKKGYSTSLISVNQAPELNNTSFGLRLHENFLSFKAGIIQSNYTRNHKAKGHSGQGPAIADDVNSRKDELDGSGTYFGFGFYYPIGKFEVYADYTVINLEYDVKSSEKDDFIRSEVVQFGLRYFLF